MDQRDSYNYSRVINQFSEKGFKLFPTSILQLTGELITEYDMSIDSFERIVEKFPEYDDLSDYVENYVGNKRRFREIAFRELKDIESLMTEDDRLFLFLYEHEDETFEDGLMVIDHNGGIKYRESYGTIRMELGREN